MKKEAIVFVRHGSPWITTNCPDCGEHVPSDQKFCAGCGQELSFQDFHCILNTGGRGIRLGDRWTRCLPHDDGVNREIFVRELKKLERMCRVHPEDGTMLEIMREAYVRNCFGGKG